MIGTPRPVATLVLDGFRHAFTLGELKALEDPVEPMAEPAECPEPPLGLVISAVVRREIERALTQTGGNPRAAAARLGIAVRTLYHNCQRCGIEPSAYRETPCATDCSLSS